MTKFSLALAVVCVAGSLFAADAPKSLSYEGDVKPILRARCFKCHGEDEKKDGLSMATYADLMKGGSSGDIVKAGRPTGSIMYLAVAHEGNDATPMPPKSPKIPDNEIEIIKKWIEQGLIEAPGGVSKAAKQRNVEFKSAGGTSAANAPMPEKLPALTLPELKHTNSITAIAASPGAPLCAVAGQERITLIDTKTKAVLGVLPFAEGVPRVLRFSRNGTVLLAAGGRGVKLGKAVLYDVKSGARLGDFGDETDEVLAADISPDQKLVAIGGPTKIVKVFNTKDGKLAYKITKHTDWVTALEFSPDGTKLATADRNGGIHLWEAASGGILLSLSEHKDGVNTMSWRADSEVLATGGEDGQLIFWDAREGWPNSQSSPHVPKSKGFGKLPGGVLSVQFANDGRLFTTGRDGIVRAWTPDGKKAAESDALPIPTTRLAVTFDGGEVLVGDLKGNVTIWSAASEKKCATLLSAK
ncbi:MAG TPA: c-type cytochrome domain-containing protein [Planctomycetota bacterium]|nr:c-type cytochrome domain-containing protein [Planctomycetota bacterium]